MKINLEDITENAEYKIAKYAAICYDADTSEDSCARRINKLLNLGHLATLRFGTATFLIEGVSRACSHQLVRSKHLDFLQESQRYVKQDAVEFIYPTNDPSFDVIYEACIKTYRELINKGIRKEDARFVLHNAATTRLYVTGNFQAWKDFLRNRTDKAAQWEIRAVALEIEKQLNEHCPNIFPIKED